MIERQDFYTEDEYTYALEQGIEFEREESMRKSLMEDMEIHMRLIDADALIQKRCHAKDLFSQPEIYVIGQGYVMDAPTIELPVQQGECDCEWKARAEALEKAIQQHASCKSCIYEQIYYFSEPCRNCKDGSPNWEFDIEHYTDKLQKCDRCGISFLPTNGLCICEKCDVELEILCQNKSETNN